MGVTPDEAIAAIHGVAASELAYTEALNAGRGLKGHTASLERTRVRAFELMVGRKPTAEELQKLCYGDA